MHNKLFWLLKKTFLILKYYCNFSNIKILEIKPQGCLPLAQRIRVQACPIFSRAPDSGHGQRGACSKCSLQSQPGGCWNRVETRNREHKHWRRGMHNEMHKRTQTTKKGKSMEQQTIVQEQKALQTKLQKQTRAQRNTGGYKV